MRDGRATPLVLIVDDDPGIRLLATEILVAAGFEVEVTGGGAAAGALCESRRPDVVLCDVVMPGMDGFELCTRIRTTPGLEHLPVVMLTSLEDVESIERAFRIGATEFIVKPINWALLPHKLKYVIRASRALRDLHISEERYALAAKGANDGLWDWDLESAEIFYSPRWMAMLGFPETAISDAPDEWLDRVHPDDTQALLEKLELHLSGETDYFECEHRIKTQSGAYRWMMTRGLAVRGRDGDAYRIVGSQTDVTKHKEAQAQLLHDALHDTLTGLPNRTLFLERLAHCIALTARRPEYRFAVIFMDLDRFKVVNDSLGHLLGDQLLIEIGNRIGKVLRLGDTLARLGGDEFTVLLEDVTDLATINRTSERMQEAIALPVILDGQEVVLGASMGVAVNTTGYEAPEDMLRDADAAMYRAKANGRGCCEIFDAQMHAEAVHTLKLESQLRSAVQRDEFELHYQPIIVLQSGGISGFEALLRWRHPTRGLLAPAEFLSVAEESRLIVPIGRFVLREACRQMRTWLAAWPEASDWSVSVNLSSQELAQPDIVDVVLRTLEESELPARALKLELTESSLIQNDSRSHEIMSRLRERGIQLSIDDFGTGYSSFNYLHRFPFDVLKIDRSFMKDLDTNPARLEIVKTVITLAHNLGLQVVAEGSENEAVENRLRSLPCEFVQGYSISSPIPPQEMDEFIAQRRFDGAANLVSPSRQRRRGRNRPVPAGAHATGAHRA